MAEKRFLAKITLLKAVKPRKDWVVLIKSKIMEQETASDSAFQEVKTSQFHSIFKIRHLLKYLEKPAYVMPVLALLVFGGIAIEQTKSSLPGDILYPVRTTIERTQFNLYSESEKAFRDVEIAQNRLEDLKRVVENNKVKNLPSTIKEFELSVEQVSRGLAELVEKDPEKALQLTLEVVQLQKDKAEIERTLGTTIGEDESGELELVTKLLVENELADLESRSLSPEQEVLFEEAKAAYDEANYETALEKIWMISTSNL